MKKCSNFAKMVSLLAAVWAFTGCDDHYLDHSITNEQFEKNIELEWYDPHRNAAHAADMKTPGWFGYAIRDIRPDGCMVKYALHLYDGKKKRFHASHSHMVELPIAGSGGTGDEHFVKEIANGRCYMWLDYELYDPQGNLLLKGSKVSEPSPNLTEKEQVSEIALPVDERDLVKVEYLVPIDQDVIKILWQRSHPEEYQSLIERRQVELKNPYRNPDIDYEKLRDSDLTPGVMRTAIGWDGSIVPVAFHALGHPINGDAHAAYDRQSGIFVIKHTTEAIEAFRERFPELCVQEAESSGR